MFKSHYPIKGDVGVLDEICYYLQRKKKNLESGFDFLDIRVQNRLNESAKQTEVPFFDIPIIGKGTKETCLIPREALGEPKEFREAIDIFVTGEDKTKLLEGTTIDSMLSKSLEYVPLPDYLKSLFKNRMEINDNINHGKPITNFTRSIVQTCLPRDILSKTILKAEDVLEKIKKGTFDIKTGLAFEG